MHLAANLELQLLTMKNRTGARCRSASRRSLLPGFGRMQQRNAASHNPVQPACVDPAEVKRQFGEALSFWGSIDEQHTLPFGTPDDVRREVIKRLKTIGKQGGLILAPTHHVQLDTPLENFWAMQKTIAETPCASLKNC